MHGVFIITMAVPLAITLVSCVIAACATTCWYLQWQNQQRKKAHSVSIFGIYPIHNLNLNSDSNECDLGEAVKTKQVVEEAGPVSDQRRSSRIWSNKSTDTANSSSGICESKRVVEVQVEVKPPNLCLWNDSIGDQCDNLSQVSTESLLTNEGSRKALLVRKLKYLKKPINFLRSKIWNQRLDIPAETLCPPSDEGTQLPSNQHLDVSTSTRISANASNLKAIASCTNRPNENGKLEMSQEAETKEEEKSSLNTLPKSQEASKNLTPSIRVSDHSRANLLNETSYLTFPQVINFVGNQLVFQRARNLSILPWSSRK